jgi:hypothetical protein
MISSIFRCRFDALGVLPVNRIQRKVVKGHGYEPFVWSFSMGSVSFIVGTTFDLLPRLFVDSDFWHCESDSSLWHCVMVQACACEAHSRTIPHFHVCQCVLFARVTLAEFPVCIIKLAVLKLAKFVLCRCHNSFIALSLGR